MALDDLDLPRYRELLAPIVGRPDLLGLEGADVVDLSGDAASPFALAFLLIALGARSGTVVTNAPVADLASAARDLVTAHHWLTASAMPLMDGSRPSSRGVVARLAGFDLLRLARGDWGGVDGERLHHVVSPVGTWAVAAETADLVLSFSLLEHVHPVSEALANLARLCRPGAVGVHLIDLVDHGFHGGEAASPHEFLSAPAYEALVRGCNRLRLRQWVEAFEAHGFEIERVEQWTSHPPPADRERATFVEPFRSMPLADVSPSGARLFVRRRGAAMRRPSRGARTSSDPSLATPRAAVAVDAAQAATTYATLVDTSRGGRASDHVQAETATSVDAAPLVQVVAFYLPQYHPIPENDEWWGRGFTEWTNVSKALPRFAGHEQPRLPGELGFYDLRVPDVQRRQATLARRFGVSAFCFYHYWFSGRRLLERPLEQFMADDAIDLPFCLCWANENWTRTWDGQAERVLIAQQHAASDDVAFIDDVASALRHERYLRIDGRPVLVVYRPGELPDPVATTAQWRARCRELGIPEPFLVATEAFATVDPRSLGFDAAVEFPPNTGGRALPPDLSDTRPPIIEGDGGAVYRYADMWRWREARPAPPYLRFRAVCPGFDNEARRPGAGSTYIHGSPAEYGRWLEGACRSTLARPTRDHRVVFVNAWNEWAEAAYLEPDRRHGYAYLDATARALNALRTDWTLLVVSHDAHCGGAQQLLLSHLAWLTAHTAIRCVVVCLQAGRWLPRFEGVARTALWSDLESAARERGDADLREVLLDLCGGTPAVVLANSVASGRALPAVAALGVPVVTYVHELPASIARYAAGQMPHVLGSTSEFVASGPLVAEYLAGSFGVTSERVTTLPGAVPPRDALVPTAEPTRPERRRALGLPSSRYCVMASGVGMPFRKGADWFIEVARLVQARGRADVSFVWVGGFPEDAADAGFGRWGAYLSARLTDDVPVSFTGAVDDVAPYLQTADVFLLPSREEPFGLVGLEAAACGLATVCFAGASGVAPLVGDGGGVVVPVGDIEAMAEAALALLDDPAGREAAGRRARERWASHYTPDAVTPALLTVLRRAAQRPPTVSVIVPNYNHAPFLATRLDSIVQQGFRDVEILILDDASTDDSLDVIARYRDRADVRVIVNARNSGSPFAQWLRGLDETRGEFVWIAESDDAADPDLLGTLVEALRDPTVKVAYANSRVWNAQGEVTGDYATMPYLTSVSPAKWRAPYRIDAADEVNDGFGVKNTILTASAVLFRRFAIDDGLRDELTAMRFAGDWRFFAAAMQGGEVAYTPRALNYHRRHADSVVGRLLRERRVDVFWQEFAAVQRWIVATYRLRPAFEARWEAYLREQWDAFFPGRPFEEFADVYPLHEMRARIRAATSV